ncbi:hypothetical protein LX36DRAFT_43733 [Colletotrichum falcatum]|nr:hypothetical protein LX36DRAFT_43733 [Colletotrichum falcatum]
MGTRTRCDWWKEGALLSTPRSRLCQAINHMYLPSVRLDVQCRASSVVPAPLVPAGIPVAVAVAAAVSNSTWSGSSRPRPSFPQINACSFFALLVWIVA